MQIVSDGDNLRQMETICVVCQNLFSGKTKQKYFKMLSAEISTQIAKH